MRPAPQSPARLEICSKQQNSSLYDVFTFTNEKEEVTQALRQQALSMGAILSQLTI